MGTSKYGRNMDETEAEQYAQQRSRSSCHHPWRLHHRHADILALQHRDRHAVGRHAATHLDTHRSNLLRLHTQRRSDTIHTQCEEIPNSYARDKKRASLRGSVCTAAQTRPFQSHELQNSAAIPLLADIHGIDIPHFREMGSNKLQKTREINQPGGVPRQQGEQHLAIQRDARNIIFGIPSSGIFR